MSHYLMRFSYTPETWARLIQNPEDRRDAARSFIEQVGGKLHGFWYGFGEYDGYVLFEASDNVSMASVILAIAGGGALRHHDPDSGGHLHALVPHPVGPREARGAGPALPIGLSRSGRTRHFGALALARRKGLAP